MQIQAALFKKIREVIPNPKELPKILQDLLGVSADSSYRRLRGETALSIDEAFKLSKHFKIALSDLENFRNDHVIFEKKPFVGSLQGFESFMKRSLAHLEMIKADPKHVFINMSKDIPSFYLYKYRELGAFKLYTWMRSLLEIQTPTNEAITVNSIPEVFLALANKQWEAYSQINAIEIWNENTCQSLLKQIEYYYDAGLLPTKEEALQLCDQVDEVLKVMYKQARSGKRTNFANEEKASKIDYKLYYNEVMSLDNQIIAKANKRITYSIPYGELNYLTTINVELTNDMHDFALKQANKSTLLSEVSEKECNQFFARLRNNVEVLRRKIQSSNPFVI